MWILVHCVGCRQTQFMNVCRLCNACNTFLMESSGKLLYFSHHWIAGLTESFGFHCCQFIYIIWWICSIIALMLALLPRLVCAPCGLWSCKNWPAPFPGRMSYKATKPSLVAVLYLSMHYTVLLFIRAPFYVSLVFVAMSSVFWLFWLSYLYLPSDWLEKILWRTLIVARGSSPESPGRRVRIIFLVCCITSLFYYVFVLSPAPMWYIYTAC